METPGIVLVHGYSGTCGNLEPLAMSLRRRFDEKSIFTVNLPGHDGVKVPRFDSELFEQSIDNAVSQYKQAGRQIILIGHSTGGSLILSLLHKRQYVPKLLVLASVPAHVDGSSLKQWETHQQGRNQVMLSDIAKLVSFINTVGKRNIPDGFPVFVLHGANDLLVNPSDTEYWQANSSVNAIRCLTIPGAGHDLFSGPYNHLAIEEVGRTATDAITPPNESEIKDAQELIALEGNPLSKFLSNIYRIPHCVGSPAARRALGANIPLSAKIKTDPCIVNIEVTSKCNLNCAYCARQQHSKNHCDMEKERFIYLLNLLPNTYKIILVGLGEPTLHPNIVDLVSLAAHKGHHVGLVTNGMTLDKQLSAGLIHAGLHSITFSLDSSIPEIAANIRSGTDVIHIIKNIRTFTDLSRGVVKTAVFSAISMMSIITIEELAQTVAELGVDAWMLSDLNFPCNASHSIRINRHKLDMNPFRNALRYAYSQHLPVLYVRALEEFGLSKNYPDFLIRSVNALSNRSILRRWCLSPWQTLPVDVDGNVTICDCQPDAFAGNLFEEPFEHIWNGLVMQKQRRMMSSEELPLACRLCPRL